MDVKESLVRMDKKETCLFELVEKKRVTWEITHQCNYRCLHCCTKAGERYENELITSRVLSLIDEMSNCDVEGIYFSGGEPLMRKDICDIIAKAASKNMKRLSLATNGSLISEDFAGRLSKSGLHSALISLDGHTADVHNSLRGIKKAYADALNGTSLLSKKGIKVRAGTVIWEKNKDFLDEIILVALKNGATSVFFNWLLKVGNGLGNHSIYVDWKEYFKIAKKLGDLKEKYKGKIEVGYHRFQIIESDFPGCFGGEKILHVTADGKIGPCSWVVKQDKTFLSNRTLHEVSFQELLKDAVIRKFRKMVKERERKLGVGCPAMCYSESNSYFVCDPLYRNGGKFATKCVD